MNDNNLNDDDHADQEARNEERAEVYASEMAELQMGDKRMEENARRKDERKGGGKTKGSETIEEPSNPKSLRPIGRIDALKLYRQAHPQTNGLAEAKSQTIGTDELERFAQENGYTLNPNTDSENESLETLDAQRTENTPKEGTQNTVENANLKNRLPMLLPSDEWREIVSRGIPDGRLAAMGIPNASFATRSIISAALLECEGLAELNGGRVLIQPIHLWLGLNAVGRIEQTAEHRKVSLPAKIYSRWGLDDERYLHIREQILATTKIERNPGGGGGRRPAEHSEILKGIFAEAQRLKEVCSGQDSYCAARHLVAALLSWTERDPEVSEQLESYGLQIAAARAALDENLKQHEALDDTEAWKKEIPRSAGARQQAPPLATGAPAHGREAREDELCLNIKSTSQALAKTIAVGTKGDFCIALKGAWGRGKTTLINAVEKELKDEPVKYAVVKFNAWKYPQRPEVWVYLYQKIQEKAEEGGWWNKARLVFHQSIEAFGWWPLLGALALFQISVLPTLSLITGAVQTLGLMATVLVVLFTNNASKFFRTIRLRYFTPTDHSGHLGLQATIGQDLKNLLKVWIRQPEQAIPGKWCAWLFSALAVSSVATMFYRFTGHWLFDPQVWNGKPTWIFVSQIGWCAGAFLLAVIPWVLRRPPEGPGRVLLVVDDLDRCAPDSMIHIIESIRLLLDEEDVNQRLQTAVLFDEAMLREALATKYAARERPDTDEAAREAKIQRLVRGQLDKYFLLEFNLPPLTPEETKEYLETLLDWDELEARKAEEAARIKREEKERTDREAELRKWSEEDARLKRQLQEVEVARETAEYQQWKTRNKGWAPAIVHGIETMEPAPTQFEATTSRSLSPAEKKGVEEEIATHEQKKPQPLPPQSQAKTPTTPAAPPANPIDRFAFSEEERDQIRQIFESGELESPAPRTIRSFLLRCQLAQFILTTSNTPFDGPTLINSVANAYLHTSLAVETGPETRVAKYVV